MRKSAVSGQSSVANTALINTLSERVNILSYLAYISSSAEVANTILNTAFLQLILKLMKINVNYQASAPLRNLSSTQNIPTTATSLSQSSRYLCVTVLALTLRYATNIQPPAIRARDDHIVGSLVALLKDTSANIKSVDLKLRRRAVAALGEIVFYISAQEEDSVNAINTEVQDKWTFPSSAIELLGKYLKEDGDEIIKHYAAKVKCDHEKCSFYRLNYFILYRLCFIRP